MAIAQQSDVRNPAARNGVNFASQLSVSHQSNEEDKSGVGSRLYKGDSNRKQSQANQKRRHAGDSDIANTSQAIENIILSNAMQSNNYASSQNMNN